MLLPHPFQPSQPLLTKESPLTANLSTKDLPRSYWRLLEIQNGGYVRNMVVPTEEPTSDGLDHANLHYLFGLHAEGDASLLHQQGVAGLPDYFIIFSAHGTQLFAFDYSNLAADIEPAIRYLDLETDNWQLLAPNFPSFLEALEPGKVAIPLEGPLSNQEAEHAFLLAEAAEELDSLFLHLEADSDKAWYFCWLAYFASHPDASFRQSALEALETQILYFRRELPPETEQVLERFFMEDDARLRKKAQELLAEWQKLPF